MKILVTGSTGHMGSAVIAHLLKDLPADQIHTMTRSEEKRGELAAKGLTTFIGDYNDPASLERAMDGVDTILLISAGDAGDRMQEHKNVVDVALKTGVRSIAYTSRSLRDRATLANPLMEDHFATEDYIRERGIPHIFFRNALYMDTIPYYLSGDVLQTGRLAQIAGNGRVAFALRSEQSEAMANVLLHESFRNQTYRFTNTETYSFYDVADALSEISGKRITYIPVEPAEWKTAAHQRGMPDALIEKIAAFNLDIAAGQESIVTGELEEMLGRRPTSLKEGMKTLFPPQQTL